MKKRPSLIRRLSWRLIVLQCAALTLVVLVASIPEPQERGLPKVDEDALEAIAENLQAEGARLFVPPDPDLLAHVADYPEFWFMVADDQGRRGEYGPVPDRIRGFFDRPELLIEVEIYWDAGAGLGGVIGERRETALGPVTILTGGGPVLYPVIGRLREINPYYLALLVVLTSMLALAIPWLVRKDLAGVSRVAKEAARIDIDQPGTRLTEADVPPELQGMVAAMNAALTRLDEGLERRRRFLATAAHELRTPVAVLSMRIEQLPKGAERRQLMLDVARLAALADQLLDLERLEADKGQFARLDLTALVREAVADVAPLAVSAGADLSYDPRVATVPVMADRQAVQRVVTNLVQNAIAHGGPGVAVTVELLAPAELVVRDTGPGIATEDRDKVFEPFFRRSGAGGSGLGLHLVQEIVTRHGGTVTLGEAPGGGAEFILRFPLAE